MQQFILQACLIQKASSAFKLIYENEKGGSGLPNI